MLTVFCNLRVLPDVIRQFFSLEFSELFSFLFQFLDSVSDRFFSKNAFSILRFSVCSVSKFFRLVMCFRVSLKVYDSENVPLNLKIKLDWIGHLNFLEDFETYTTILIDMSQS